MKIAYGSDFHLEFGGRNFEFPEADVLVLAGDIMVFDDLTDGLEFSQGGHDSREFLLEASAAYKHVIYIPGNHEFYGGNLDTSREKLNTFLRREGITNIIYSQNGCVVIDDVTFIFATLWTDLNRGNPLVVASNNMSDYRQIMLMDDNLPSGGRYIIPQDTIDLHAYHKVFIERKLGVASTEKVVVVTHHAPNMMSHEEGMSVSNQDYYYCCTDMDSIILDNPQIKLWIHGHLHTRKSYNIGDTLITSNCRGYIGHEEMANKYQLEVITV